MGAFSYRSNQPWIALRAIVYANSGANHSRVRWHYPLSSRFAVRCNAGLLALEMDVEYTFYCGSFCSADHACGRVVPGATPDMVADRIRLLRDLLASGAHGS